MVHRLGPKLFRLCEGVRRAGDHGGLFLNDHDAPVQNARSRAGLAKGDDQVVSAPALSRPAALAADVPSSISVRHASKRFTAPDGTPVEALADVALEIAAGQLVSLVGPSGCGKSTL